MFGTIDENGRDEYNYEKLHWNYWKSFNKFYGYATLEDYIEFNSIDEKDEVSLEWTEYTSAFPNLNAKLFLCQHKHLLVHILIQIILIIKIRACICRGKLVNVILEYFFYILRTLSVFSFFVR